MTPKPEPNTFCKLPSSNGSNLQERVPRFDHIPLKSKSHGKPAGERCGDRRAAVCSAAPGSGARTCGTRLSGAGLGRAAQGNAQDLPRAGELTAGQCESMLPSDVLIILWERQRCLGALSCGALGTFRADRGVHDGMYSGTWQDRCREATAGCSSLRIRWLFVTCTITSAAGRTPVSRAWK